MHQMIAERRSEIAELCRRYHVRRLEVIGSAARGTDFDPSRSDVDFLVEFGSAPDLEPLGMYFGLRRDLSELLNRPVDLLPLTALTNPYVRADIDRARELLYAA